MSDSAVRPPVDPLITFITHHSSLSRTTQANRTPPGREIRVSTLAFEIALQKIFNKVSKNA